MRTRLIVAVLVLAAGAGLPGVARAQTCAATVPHLTGEWVTLPYQMPINPISATLLRSGQVLIVAGSENDAKNNSEGSESYRAALWDPTGATRAASRSQELTYDVFCSGTATLPDGRPLVVGGTSDYSFTGESRASFFDPLTGRSGSSRRTWWMAAGTPPPPRWATGASWRSPELTPDRWNEQHGRDLRPEERRSRAGSTRSRAPFTPPLYPRMALLPNGKVFYTGHGSGGSNASGWIFDPVAQDLDGLRPDRPENRTYGTSVLLPLLPPDVHAEGHGPRRRQPGDGHDRDHRPLRRLSGLDAGPEHVHGAHPDERGASCPNGKVLAAGRIGEQRELRTGPGKAADLYDPDRQHASARPAPPRIRGSTTRRRCSCPDARVMSIGQQSGTRGSYQAAIEIYTPAVSLRCERPTDHHRSTGHHRRSAPSSGVDRLWRSVLGDATPTSSPISSAVLVRPGSVDPCLRHGAAADRAVWSGAAAALQRRRGR